MKEIFSGGKTEIHYTGSSGSIVISWGCIGRDAWPVKTNMLLSTYAKPSAVLDEDMPWCFFLTQYPEDLRAIAAGLNAAADALEESQGVDMT